MIFCLVEEGERFILMLTAQENRLDGDEKSNSE